MAIVAGLDRRPRHAHLQRPYRTRRCRDRAALCPSACPRPVTAEGQFDRRHGPGASADPGDPHYPRFRTHAGAGPEPLATGLTGPVPPPPQPLTSPAPRAILHASPPQPCLAPGRPIGARNGIPCAGVVGPWFTRADRRPDVSLKTLLPRSLSRPHRPRNIARRYVSQRCAGPRGIRLRGTLPPPAAPTQRDTYFCCTMFHIAGKSLKNHGFARPWPVQHAQRGCFTALRRTAPAPNQRLCNRPRLHGASCFTGGDGGVRHRDDPDTPNETSPPGMFHSARTGAPRTRA